MSAHDKLRPWTEIEACECDEVRGLLLVDILTDNPIHCAHCRREVDPERIRLSDTQTDDIARWFSAASALYRLWLHSGEYEEYAKARLLDPTGEINRDGRRIARELSEQIPTQHWFFYDMDDGDPVDCPVCGRPLDLNVRWGAGQCEKCHVHI